MRVEWLLLMGQPKIRDAEDDPSYNKRQASLRMSRESNQIDRSPDDLLKYPRYDEREVIFRWRVDWWDGPING